jgi:hypothetical protein
VLGTGLDELLRHVTALRPAGLQLVLSIFRTLARLGGQPAPPAGPPGPKPVRQP